MKNTFLPSIFFILFSISSLLCGQELPEVDIIAHVVDEKGKPIEDVEVGAWFPQTYGAGSSAKGLSIKAKTDVTGNATLTGTTSGSVGFGARKEGYYKSVSEMFNFMGMQAMGKALETNKTLIMKKIKDPIPLYARHLRHIKIPDFNAPFGFDLEAGDWVSPHGKGKITDMIFQTSGTHKNYREHDLTLEISFPNVGDGLVMFEGAFEVGSALRSDHLAPESGYKPSLVLRRKALYEQKSSQWLNDSKPGSNYYLRTRTKLDEKGSVICANYGKIYGNFEFLDFIRAEAYYFNPIGNDRNLEFDTKCNLSNPSNSFEKVLMP
jgi:hypothetical protein